MNFAHRLQRHNQTLLVLLAYTVLTCVVTWPVVGRLGSHIPGNAGDAWVHLWNFVWVRDALASGSFTFHTDLIYYPDGVSLLNSNIAWVQFFFWWVWQFVVGITTAYTITFLATIIFNAVAAYWLAHTLTDSVPAAFVAGLVVGFWPYSLSHHNHPNGILIGWIPIALVWLWRWGQNGRLSSAMWLGASVALIGLSRWQHLLMALPILGLFCSWVWWQQRAQQPIGKSVRQLFLAGALAFLLMAPLLLPTLRNQQTTTYEPDTFAATQTNALAYVLPNRYHPWWGEQVYPWYEANNIGVNRDFIPFVGYTVLILAMMALWGRWRQGRFWGAVALLYLSLAVGPSLQIGSRTYEWLLPSDLIAGTQVATILRHPDRFNYLLGIPFGLLAAWGVVVLGQRRQTHAWSWGVGLLFSLLILVEYVVVYATLPTAVPTWYEQVAAETGEFALLTVPLNSRTTDKAFMYYQLTHGKALVGGHVSRQPETAVRFQQASPLLRALQQNEQVVPDLVDVSHQLEQLGAAGVRYLVLDKHFLARESEVGWVNWLGQPPYYEDNDLMVYRLDEPLQSLPTMHTFGDLALVQADLDKRQAGVGELLTLTTRWYAKAAVKRPLTLCWQLVNSVGTVAQEQCEPLSSTRPTDQWQANGIFKPQPYQLWITPYLATDRYTIRLSVDGNEGVVGEVEITAVERTFTPPAPQHTTAHQWQAQIALIGYDFAQTTEAVSVTLYWQALQRMDTSYKYFVHIIEPQTGQVVAQADLIPRQWSYPTTWWEAEEYIDDGVTLPLSELPQGEYELWTGFYDAENGVLLENGRVQLTEFRH